MGFLPPPLPPSPANTGLINTLTWSRFYIISPLVTDTAVLRLYLNSIANILKILLFLSFVAFRIFPLPKKDCELDKTFCEPNEILSFVRCYQNFLIAMRCYQNLIAYSNGIAEQQWDFESNEMLSKLFVSLMRMTKTLIKLLC